MKAAQLLATNPRRHCRPGIRFANWAQLQANAPANGPGPSCAGAMATELGAGLGVPESSRKFDKGSLVRGRRWGRSIAARAARRKPMRRFKLQYSRHGLGRWRLISTSSSWCSPWASSFDPRDPHMTRSHGRDHDAACARSSTTGAKAKTRRALPPHVCAMNLTCMCPRRCRSHSTRPAAHHELAGGRAVAPNWEGKAAGKSGATHWRSNMLPRLVRGRSISYGVIHGDPHLGNYTVAARNGSVKPEWTSAAVRIFPPALS